ncbi:1-aminocyclopropane-1-carboxylate oxidase homolog 1-like [Rhododendron vialii]|uniref:1-aminocyclopropane-1-carboxylate oxidase homolog 1-like n=1 Tax=Rhododendron vialii TaxID=182163 RepID=UPI00265F24F2|nr:1-aminocyclopropane-1-carboxylate oxidase homolog 1-like [Rhododendron vialii]
MDATTITTQPINTQYDWAKQVKEFDETKAGVKGLVDAGIKKLPEFFVYPPESLENLPPKFPLELPTVDFKGVEGGRRREVVEGIRAAASGWGFFRMVNHGVPSAVMEEMLEATRMFHEQRREDKMEYYSGDSKRRVRFNTGGRIRVGVFSWRDILTCVFHDDYLDPQAIPLVCRKEVQEYVKCMIKLRETMAELLSEALGLSSDYLSRIECMKSEALASLYYPICPEPHLTLGTPKHTDTTFLTLLLQDHIGGLQILHKNQWVDVPPVPGTLIANIGDLMQIISNDKFISVEHRVLAQPFGPRVSVACFFSPSSKAADKHFGPIKELLSEESPQIYREFLCNESFTYYTINGQDVESAFPHFKL